MSGDGCLIPFFRHFQVSVRVSFPVGCLIQMCTAISPFFFFFFFFTWANSPTSPFFHIWHPCRCHYIRMPVFPVSLSVATFGCFITSKCAGRTQVTRHTLRRLQRQFKLIFKLFPTRRTDGGFLPLRPCFGVVRWRSCRGGRWGSALCAHRVCRAENAGNGYG